MFKITFLGLEDSISSFITGPLDLFYHTGRIWNVINGDKEDPFFEVELVSLDGKKITCQNGITLQPKCSIFDSVEQDLIVISSSSFDIGWTLEKYKPVLPYLRSQFEKGIPVASLCIGAFLIAEAGLLNGRKASTHWGFCNLFEEMYPQVKLCREELISEDTGVFTSGGANSGLDLTLYLIEKFSGHSQAMNVAKSFVLELGRHGQAPFSKFIGRRSHSDKEMLIAQEWIENNCNRLLSFNEISEKLVMSQRTLNRRFKEATGLSPVDYLQNVRIESAKIFLETGNDTVQEIAYLVGYEDISFFRKVFKKITGITPNQYRQMYRVRNQIQNGFHP
ncbi:MAG TPA: helix-turn-helix domain-containing protein [Leptospiraceae bacterium]|nr:helix-turn-helix domain-containing protein [Leptospiraceae bacterium]HMW04707.1 helix-turn-helix domain-containing protein [Leptospiraceae bacterium]HMX31738.1 helix-turn-helix domain-containing protein [Leptospiraceae bacterium]HMY30544.1 helix-turn-helix domain-containing protein [Leptospiraceae bacterium]HMZ64155.1 helix-turn-helix domain-containing protein [Leptospiraceae bacterium]